MLLRLLDKLGTKYLLLSLLTVVLLTQLSGVIGIVLLYLYRPMPIDQFWTILIVTELLLLLDNVLRSIALRRRLAPVQAWIAGDDDGEEAWRIVAGLPLSHVRRWLLPSIMITLVPATVFISSILNIGPEGIVMLLIGGSVAVLYSVAVRYLGLETAMSPILAQLGRQVPATLSSNHPSLSLRTKMIVLLPAINVITGVVVAGLVAPPEATLDDLAFSVVIAAAVTMFLSSAIVLMLTQSALAPVQRLEEAGRSLAEGDLGAVAPPTTPDEAGALGGHLAQIADDLDRGRQARETLDRFVDIDVAARLLDEEDGDLWSGSEEDVTVLFCDLKGFSIKAAQEPARQTLERLRRFYRIVVPIIEANGGHANKFIGDGLMAIFGSPTAIDNHADGALAAAEEIADQLHESPDLNIAIGLNSGRALVGTVSAAGRLDFTVVGEVVNTAARIEALTRETGDEILLTEATRSRLSSGRVLTSRGHFDIDELDFPVLLWTPEEDKERVYR